MITTDLLYEARDVLSISGLAKAAGIKRQNLYTKLRRRRPLSKKEASKIDDALAERGIALVPTPAQSLR